MCAIDLKDTASRDELRVELYKKKVILLPCGDKSLRFRPHLNVTKEEITLALNKIEEALAN